MSQKYVAPSEFAAECAWFLDAPHGFLEADAFAGFYRGQVVVIRDPGCYSAFDGARAEVRRFFRSPKGNAAEVWHFGDAGIRRWLLAQLESTA